VYASGVPLWIRIFLKTIKKLRKPSLTPDLTVPHAGGIEMEVVI